MTELVQFYREMGSRQDSEYWQARIDKQGPYPP